MDEVRTSAVSPGVDAEDGPLRKRAAMADPNPLKPTADAVGAELSIQIDAAVKDALTRVRDRIVPQQQQY